jgi:hypothetical protein
MLVFLQQIIFISMQKRNLNVVGLMLINVYQWAISRPSTRPPTVISIFAYNASAADPDDLQKLKDTNICFRCDLDATYLQDADLQGADLFKADLSGANLYNANLKSVDLSSANLRIANLEGANLSGANLKNAILKYTRMQDAILCNTTMPDGSVIFIGC